MATAAAAVRRTLQAPVPGRPDISFAIRFVVLITLFVAALAVLDPEPALISFTAWLTRLASGLVDLPARVLDGPADELLVVFRDGAFSYRITEACTAIELGFLFTAAVVAFPATWRQRSTGLVGGLSAICALNILRLVVLAWVGINAQSLFDPIHLYWYQGFLIVSVGLGWFGWATVVARNKDRESKPRIQIRNLAADMGLFIATFTVLATFSAVLELSGAYRRLLLWSVFVIGGIAYDDPNVRVNVLPGRMLLIYATLIAVIVLFMCVTSIPWRERLRALLRRGLPVTLGTHVAGAFVQYATHRSQPTGAVWITFGAELAMTVIPLLVWFMWVRGGWRGNDPTRPHYESR